MALDKEDFGLATIAGQITRIARVGQQGGIFGSKHQCATKISAHRLIVSQSGADHAQTVQAFELKRIPLERILIRLAGPPVDAPHAPVAPLYAMRPGVMKLEPKFSSFGQRPGGPTALPKAAVVTLRCGRKSAELSAVRAGRRQRAAKSGWQPARATAEDQPTERLHFPNPGGRIRTPPMAVGFRQLCGGYRPNEQCA